MIRFFTLPLQRVSQKTAQNYKKKLKLQNYGNKFQNLLLLK